jgi:uncharacterized membrane protein
MDVTFRLFLILHVVAGTAAILTGIVPLFSPKPIGQRAPVHRKVGRLFVLLMAVVIGSAVVMTALRPHAYFVGLTTSALNAVFSGMRVLQRKRPDVDPKQRAKALDWAVALLVAGVCITLLVLLAQGRITRNVPVVRALAYGPLAYAAYDLWRFMRPRGFPFTPNLWLYEHLVKMTGAYFAAMAAFSGSVLVLFPPPWRQLWAVSTGFVIAIAGVFYYRRKVRAVSA